MSTSLDNSEVAISTKFEDEDLEILLDKKMCKMQKELTKSFGVT